MFSRLECEQCKNKKSTHAEHPQQLLHGLTNSSRTNSKLYILSTKQKSTPASKQLISFCLISQSLRRKISEQKQKQITKAAPLLF